MRFGPAGGPIFEPDTASQGGAFRAAKAAADAGEQSLSPFYTVDAFKNNKYQLLFNTKTHLHLIDRNGNYVPGFPLKLPATATNPISLLDYDKTRDYRIIVACSDNKIYNYNITGTKNERFTPIKVDHPVYLPVKYAKVGASDYLIANDSEGKIYVYSRRGEGRIDLSNKLITNSSNYFIDVANNVQNTTLIYYDDKNSLIRRRDRPSWFEEPPNRLWAAAWV